MNSTIAVIIGGFIVFGLAFAWALVRGTPIERRERERDDHGETEARIREDEAQHFEVPSLRQHPNPWKGYNR